MGLLKHLLFWPVTGPNFLARFSLEKVQDAVKEQLTDDQLVKEDLLALQMQLELGEIDDHEYMAREAELMQRLREVREWREEFGMGMAGGPVRVARQEPSGVDEEAAAPAEGADEGSADQRDADVDEDDSRRGGIASSEGASVEFDLDRD